MQKADEQFQFALSAFKTINHLKGQCLALKHSAATRERIPGADVSSIKKELDAADQHYLRYIKDTGIDNCHFIPRKQSDEISLMTELVLSEDTPKLFPVTSVGKEN